MANATVINAETLYERLLKLNLKQTKGEIIFNLGNVSVKISTTDTVGITLQAWLKQYLLDNKIYFKEPSNTQEFPDFFLNPNSIIDNMLEIKAFKYDATPAFDIANFESYCSAVKEKPFRLDADYLIFGYTMSDLGDITIEKIWLHKIWEIAGISEKYPLKTQVKRDMIYNIRPNTNFKKDEKGPFNKKEDFLLAIYDTLVKYKDRKFADNWKKTLEINYKKFYNQNIKF